MSDVLEATDLELILLEQLDEAIPCVVVARSFVCGRDDEHPADWEVLWSCGCVLHYCNKAFDGMRRFADMDVISCSRSQHREPIHIIAAEPIGRHH